MSIYHWILISGFLTFIVSSISILIKVFSQKGKKDFAPVKGNIRKAITYSFTGAMSPVKKESAYLHLPTYTAGLIFHIGTFLSFFWLILLFLNIHVNSWFGYASSIVIITAGVCGVSIFIKRIVQIKLRNLSNPDDYFSNLLVTGFQICTAVTLLFHPAMPVLFIYGSLLLIYIPVGKLRHTIYFFSSRIYLGIYYGRRGVWPVEKK
ncbi:MAG: hypothetical protein WC599_14430 [Bacteroidales bacterium]